MTVGESSIDYVTEQLEGQVGLVGSDNRPIALENGIPVLTVNDSVNSTTEGLDPVTTAQVWVMSDPQQIGQTPADADGRIVGTYSFPKKLEAGNHRFVVRGYTEDGKEFVVAIGMVVETASESSRSMTLIAVLLLGFGVIVVAVIGLRLRRRP